MNLTTYSTEQNVFEMYINYRIHYHVATHPSTRTTPPTHGARYVICNIHTVTL